MNSTFGDDHPTHCRHGLDKEKYFCTDDGLHLRLEDKEEEEKFSRDLTRSLNNIFNKG